MKALDHHDFIQKLWTKENATWTGSAAGAGGVAAWRNNTQISGFYVEIQDAKSRGASEPNDISNFFQAKGHGIKNILHPPKAW